MKMLSYILVVACFLGNFSVFSQNIVNFTSFKHMAEDDIVGNVAFKQLKTKPAPVPDITKMRSTWYYNTFLTGIQIKTAYASIEGRSVQINPAHAHQASFNVTGGEIVLNVTFHWREHWGWDDYEGTGYITLNVTDIETENNITVTDEGKLEFTGKFEYKFSKLGDIWISDTSKSDFMKDITETWKDDSFGIGNITEGFEEYMTKEIKAACDAAAATEILSYPYQFDGIKTVIDLKFVDINLTNSGFTLIQKGVLENGPSKLAGELDFDTSDDEVKLYSRELFENLANTAKDQGYMVWELTNETAPFDLEFNFTVGVLAVIVPEILRTHAAEEMVYLKCVANQPVSIVMNTTNQVLDLGIPIYWEANQTKTKLNVLNGTANMTVHLKLSVNEAMKTDVIVHEISFTNTKIAGQKLTDDGQLLMDLWFYEIAGCHVRNRVFGSDMQWNLTSEDHIWIHEKYLSATRPNQDVKEEKLAKPTSNIPVESFISNLLRRREMI